MDGNEQIAAVSNSTPLIYFAKIGRLDVLRVVFDKIFIPEAVFEETVIRGKHLTLATLSLSRGLLEYGSLRKR
ncbi:MAG: hypothetical protein H5T50_02330 [Nitrososphaeria archaeon]|nr:hypothetical protein [Nitrososphaeria archaeon]